MFQRVFWLPNLLEVGTWDRFRVTNSNGQFFLKFDPLDGSGWRLLCPDGGIDTCSASAAAYWDNGIAMGETEQWGLGTSMRDQQNQLDYRDDSGTWTAWPDSNCIIDEATGWKWSQTSGDSYEVVAGGGAACSQ